MARQPFIDSEALERSVAVLRESSHAGDLMADLEQIMDATCELFGASGAGIMMIDENTALTPVAATDELGRLLEVRQQEVGEGPCVDALMLDRIVSTDDLAVDDRWPALQPDLPQAGLRAILGVPVHVAGVAVGSLNVYRDGVAGWSESEHSALSAYARVIETVLGAALRSHAQGRLVDQLQKALDNRVMIERAVGVIMERRRVGAVAAFNEIRRTARSAERRVVDVAVDMLADYPDHA